MHTFNSTFINYAVPYCFLSFATKMYNFSLSKINSKTYYSTQLSVTYHLAIVQYYHQLIALYSTKQ